MVTLVGVNGLSQLVYRIVDVVGDVACLVNRVPESAAAIVESKGAAVVAEVIWGVVGKDRLDQLTALVYLDRARIVNRASQGGDPVGLIKAAWLVSALSSVNARCCGHGQPTP